jgi:short-subunit dehydrogenase
VNGPWRSALVTGASSGIGRELARQVAGRGADVTLVARRAERLEDLAAELRGRHGVDVEVLVADLGDESGVRAVEERIADPERPVDLVVNNAGLGSQGTFHALPLDHAEAEVRLNALAVLRLSHAALAAMVPRGRGGLLNVSSLSGFQPLPGTASYAATKAFVTSLSQSLHEEVRASGVHVTVLCPGFTRTEFHSAGAIERSGLPARAWLSAASVARAGLDAVTRNQAVCIPGAGYRALILAAGLLPRGVLRRVTGALNQSNRLR